jgi:ABC-type transport system involved in cytochrome c biogenesis ATPase subunit
VLRQRLGLLHRVGPGQESFPLLLDEPFTRLGEEAVAPLLSLLLEQSQHQQILLLTAQGSITSWARLESMTGALEVVEPMPNAMT